MLCLILTWTSVLFFFRHLWLQRFLLKVPNISTLRYSWRRRLRKKLVHILSIIINKNWILNDYGLALIITFFLLLPTLISLALISPLKWIWIPVTRISHNLVLLKRFSYHLSHIRKSVQLFVFVLDGCVGTADWEKSLRSLMEQHVLVIMLLLLINTF